ncbi:MAG: hypothetical protein ABJH52_14755 [Henriciella sp.]
MLLRRITKHVKEQNWFAVGLDFVIVVVGVFIGIQVANWNASQNDHSAYLKAHDRMVSEVRRNIANQNAVIELILPKFMEFQQATEDLRLCRTDSEAEERIRNTLDLLGATLSPSYQTTAINTLTNSERLLEQQSEEFRNLYFEYARFLTTRKNWSEQQSSLLSNRTSQFHSLLSVDKPGTGPDWLSAMSEIPRLSNRKKILISGIDDACKDRALLNMFVDWETGTDYQMGLMQEVISRSESFLEALGEP